MFSDGCLAEVAAQRDTSKQVAVANRMPPHIGIAMLLTRASEHQIEEGEPSPCSVPPTSLNCSLPRS
jgi:hypothetical protein